MLQQIEVDAVVTAVNQKVEKPDTSLKFALFSFVHLNACESGLVNK